ncbi:MAG: hypothetical protein JWL96_2239, partial [Sphingomonas bacterium]|uniref:hypothetical protein n=1 Tax=Sphingomonas bacterium TaxID=1895847 RepID=UPI002602AB6C
MSPGGVDMRTGVYAYHKRDLSVSNGSAGEMALERLEDPGILGHVAPFSNMSHNWDITLTQRNRTFASFNPASSAEYVVYVSINGRIETFQSFGTTTDFSQASRTPSSRITHTGARGAGGEVYTFTAADGTVITFRPLGLVGSSDCSDTVRCAYPSEMTSPDGTKYTFQDRVPPRGVASPARARRSSGIGRIDHAAIAGSVTIGSSLNCAT